MYLKALELQGFKSFPEKTRICFDQNVTAIVGPNGSGKSNISDALLWVMGEQRARTLRGGKMEDVIFGGTEKRSPMGFAQVTLILDNTARFFPLDTDEVSISRRYYRSGESEYSINKENVRLKDVTELLMDTGLGRDGYSVIGQGRIAEIVSARSTDRREIFEEAAGISHYRYRKEEAERRLEKTEDNLLRIDDKISELKPQVDSLREQAETAKKYLALHDELRGEEISLWMENIDRLHDQADGITRDCAELTADRDNTRSKLDSLYAGSETLAERTRDNDLEAEREREKRREAESEAAAMDSDAAVLRNSIRNNTLTIERLRKEMSTSSEKENSLQAQIEEHECRVREIDEESAAIGQKLSELREQTGRAQEGVSESAASLAALLLEESDLNAELSQHSSTLQLLRENETENNGRISSLEKDIAGADERIRQAEAEERDARQRLRDAEEELTRSENKINGRAMLLSNREKDVTACSERRQQLSEKLSRADSRISLLKELEKEYEGFNNSVKTVMNDAGHGILRGIRGPVGRMIQVDDRYALAIETALGAATQNVIVETQRDITEAVKHLQRRNAGRATFLPMNDVIPYTLKTVPSGEEGYIGVCAELVHYDQAYRKVIYNLLGRTVLAEDMRCAQNIANNYGHSFRIVTLDGQVFNPGGSVTGGSAAKNIGVLSRANELKRLTEGYADMEDELRTAAAAEQEAVRKLEKLRQELDQAREENAAARQDLSVAQGFADRSALMRETLVYGRENGSAEMENLLKRREDLSQRCREREESIGNTSEKLAFLRERISAARGSSQDAENLRRDLEQELGGCRSRLSALESEKQTVLLAASQLRELMLSVQQDTGSHRDAIAAAEEQDVSLHALLADRESLIQEKRRYIDGIRIRLEELTASRLALEEQRTANDRMIQDVNKALIDLEHRCSAFEQKLQALTMEEQQIVDKLWDSYSLSRTAAQAERRKIESYSKVSHHVSELRRAIQALGNPNIGAVEEFQRVNERYEFLSTQRDDVVRAKNEIEDIIRDVTGSMETVFREQFYKIDECFRSTFLELFGGGKAALRLEDENDVLSCGIDIRIQPPGKALSNISLLSGGEKAFVAIALYFAIMKVRPTPFCIMDEIESALDESNVQLYADYMHRLSDHTQFIVITHRRGTMESADQLFGVTMQEKGVSSVLTMNVSEAMKSLRSAGEKNQ